MTPRQTDAESGLNFFESHIGRTTRARRQLGEQLALLTDILDAAEAESRTASGSLALGKRADDVRSRAQQLLAGRFRLMMLGDMSRGKSSVLNAMVGEELLPRGATKSTALATVLRFGPTRRATIYFSAASENPPEELPSLDDFRNRYTISAADAERFELQGKQPFPDVSHAVIEYPLPLLESGVEIVDSPGLVETPERMLESLHLSSQCDAILFVVDTVNQVTPAERRYLADYLEGSGHAIFFLINKWDAIVNSIADPNDLGALRDAREEVLQDCRTAFTAFFDDVSSVAFEDRVFPVSARDALRRIATNPNQKLDGTGFPAFLHALATFLEVRRLGLELRDARQVAARTVATVHESIGLRATLLKSSRAELSTRVQAAESDLGLLAQIGVDFGLEIEAERARMQGHLSDSLTAYLSALPAKFDEDFKVYLPDFALSEFWRKEDRGEFVVACTAAFSQYLSAKLIVWARHAQEHVRKSFRLLETKAEAAGARYASVCESIVNKLTGAELGTRPPRAADAAAAAHWMHWASAAGMLAIREIVPSPIVSSAGSAAGSDCGLAVAFGLALGRTASRAAAAAAAVLGGRQAQPALSAALSDALAEQLPTIATAQVAAIVDVLNETYDRYRDAIRRKIADDIDARRGEVNSLLQQIDTSGLDRGAERARLRSLDGRLITLTERIEFMTNAPGSVHSDSDEPVIDR